MEKVAPLETKFKGRNKMLESMQKQHRQHGSTLIEAMISIFVLSFGVLVLMITQLNSVDAAVNAQNQSEVARQVDDLAESAMADPIMQVKTVSMTNGTQLVLDQSYDSPDCSKDIAVTNAQVKSCTIDGSKGTISVAWTDQSKGSDFTSTLPIGDAQ